MTQEIHSSLRSLIRFFTVVFVAGFAITLMPRIVFAVQTVPYLVNFQGNLTDSSGNLKSQGATTNFSMKFRLYATSSGGSPVWVETRDFSSGKQVSVKNGTFNVQLGEVTPLSPSLFTSQPLYLEVELPTPATASCASASCESWTEGAMTPRSQLTSSPYALNADTVDGIDGSSLAQLSASQTFSGNNTFTGTTLIKPASDSTTAFQIQSSSSAPLLVADTQNMALKVGGGDVSPNGSPALLVFDYKNTSGDPSTGINGAMYYNTTLDKLRCFEASIWKDCMSTARKRYEVHNDFISPIAYNGNNVTIDTTFTVGLGGSGATVNRIQGEVNHPGIARMDTGTTSTGVTEIAMTYDTLNPILFGGPTWTFTTQLRPNTVFTNGTQNFTMINGFYDSAGTLAPANGCYLRYVNGTTVGSNGSWQGVCETSNVEQTCAPLNSGNNAAGSVTASTWYDLRVSVNAARSLATFTMKNATDTYTCTVSSQIPTAALTAGLGLIKTLGASDAIVDYDNIEVVGDGLNR